MRSARRLRDLLIWRRDVRRFLSDPLPEGTLDALIELACLAPSVGLSQPWRFVIVEDETRRAAIRENFQACNAAALAAQSEERASLYARLKLADSKRRRIIWRCSPTVRPLRVTNSDGLLCRR